MKWNGEEGQSVGIKMKDNIKVNKSRFSGLVVHGLPLASQKENEREEADWKMERKHKKEVLSICKLLCGGKDVWGQDMCRELRGGKEDMSVCDGHRTKDIFSMFNKTS